jgi:prepilin-type N-terminal cleavage/methylation domain-containing protein
MIKMQHIYNIITGKILKQKSKRGFTLIELLVVISIIAFLSSIILTNVTSARNKAREATRKATFKQIQIALELYRTTNGSYPVTGANVFYASESGSSVAIDPNIIDNPSNYVPGLAPKYITKLPSMPGGTANSICTVPATFLYASDGTTYKLVAYCAAESLVPSTDPLWNFSDRTTVSGSAPSRSWEICSTSQKTVSAGAFGLVTLCDSWDH